MNPLRAERHRLLRDLGVPSKKMKRRRPAKPEVRAAFRDAVVRRAAELEKP